MSASVKASEEIDMAAIVSFDRLTMQYGKKVALDNVSLTVSTGGVYALLGRNGAGKSSAVRCLLGQQRPTQGRVLLFGSDVWQHRAQVMERIGVIPEEPDAPPDMTAKQIAAFCSSLYRSWDAKGVSARLERFGVPLNTPFGKLSKGQKGQVTLALALGHSPELLVLDDPTLGLDVVARKEFFEELVGELADRGTTVLITTHDLVGVEGIASHIGIVKEGRLIVNEEIEALKAKYRRIRYGSKNSQLQSQYGGELDILSAVQVKVSGWGVEAVVSNFDDHSFDKFRKMGQIVDPEVSAMSLEDIFTVVVGETKGE
jgi:ABC-2 type transport system ATP-binding protein